MISAEENPQQPTELPDEDFMTNPSLAMDACFTAFDKDGDDRLSLNEFTLICRALFRNDKGHIYVVPSDRLEQMFAVFDKNEDGYIDREEFQFCWNQWIKTIVRPISAFLIVDVQNDFISGSLNISNCSAQQNGLEVIEPINKLLDTVDFDAVFYSLDWHPSDHVSFIDNIKQRPIHPTSPLNADNAQVYDTVIFAGPPPMKQRLWPRHCVQDSWGSELHKDLKVVEHGVKVYKGTNPEVDSYSVFWDNKKLSDTTLCAQLRLKGSTDIYVCGLAYDVCVGKSLAFANPRLMDTGVLADMERHYVHPRERDAHTHKKTNKRTGCIIIPIALIISPRCCRLKIEFETPARNARANRARRECEGKKNRFAACLPAAVCCSAAFVSLSLSRCGNGVAR
ncbi:uncharacterized protein LOC1281742 isoform X2 [Anopheles gambiae]|uniref:uncharacterized protein LOC1281742 isoform X2 n=1 Tax=Anopheles gambiae TaxID=7165 RepID=UPI002AC9B0DE|nr:uncharacterized protein LOC1281742 isoform X2 [Anopheles gambiae]